MGTVVNPIIKKLTTTQYWRYIWAVNNQLIKSSGNIIDIYANQVINSYMKIALLGKKTTLIPVEDFKAMHCIGLTRIYNNYIILLQLFLLKPWISVTKKINTKKQFINIVQVKYRKIKNWHKRKIPTLKEKIKKYLNIGQLWEIKFNKINYTKYIHFSGFNKLGIYNNEIKSFKKLLKKQIWFYKKNLVIQKLKKRFSDKNFCRKNLYNKSLTLQYTKEKVILDKIKKKKFFFFLIQQLLFNILLKSLKNLFIGVFYRFLNAPINFYLLLNLIPSWNFNSAELINKAVFWLFKRKQRLAKIFRILLRALNKSLKKGKLIGFKILFSGRAERRGRSTYRWKTRGFLGITNYKIKLDYNASNIILQNSLASLKVWVAKKYYSKKTLFLI